MNIWDHLVNSKASKLIVLLPILVLEFTLLKFLAVYLAKEIKSLHNTFNIIDRGVVNTIQESSMAELQERSFFGTSIMLHHLEPEWRQLLLTLTSWPSILVLGWAISYVHLALVAAISSLGVSLVFQNSIWKLWAFKYVAKVSRTHRTSFLISVLKLVPPEMELLHMELKILLALELLLADATLMIGLDCFLVAKRFELIFNQAKVI